MFLLREAKIKIYKNFRFPVSFEIKGLSPVFRPDNFNPCKKKKRVWQVQKNNQRKDEQIR